MAPRRRISPPGPTAIRHGLVDASLALPERLGLRERKKAKTRQAISDVATRMFIDRGFDEVTVADVAGAAGVSVKTVFNYFGAKEDLLFDQEPAWLGAIDQLLTLPRPGLGLIPALHADLDTRWPALDFGRWDLLTDQRVADRRQFFELIRSHPGLQARRLTMGERLHDRFVAGVASESGDPEAPESTATGTLIYAAYDATGRELYESVLAGRTAKQVAARARSAGQAALSVLERAYAGTPLVDGPDA